jgi:GNAT superfamily N-acetyltransferase
VTPAFRPAEPSDVGVVVALVESAYRGETSRDGWTTEADLLAGQRTDTGEVAALIGRPGSLLLLAEVDGRLAGCCHLERRADGASHFGMFAVDPKSQGRGIGTAVLGEAKRLASRWGCTRMRMTVVRQREDLIAWYGRRGFEPTGETEPFPYGDERFGVPLRDDLEFVVLESSLP